MKKLLLFIAIAFMGMKAVAQVPTSGLVFRQDFTGNFNDSSTTGAVAVTNTATLTSDYNGMATSSGNFDLGQIIEYALATNPTLMAGSTNAQISISFKAKIDPIWRSGLNGFPGDYINMFNIGNCYIRILRESSTYITLQSGIYNGGGLVSANKIINGGSGDSELSGWNTYTLTYGAQASPAGTFLKLYVNGVLQATSAAVIATNKNIIYNSPTEKLTIGKSSEVGNNFKGQIDDVLIYNSCLTQAQVSQVYGASIPLPVATSPQIFCNPTSTLFWYNLLPVGGTNSIYKWYTSQTGGSPMSGYDTISSGVNYYVSQTLNGVESYNRKLVVVLVSNVATPAITTPQSIPAGGTLADVVNLLPNITWFASQSNANGNTSALPLSTVVNSGKYYAVQTVGTCRSTPKEVFLVLTGSSVGNPIHEFTFNNTLFNINNTASFNGTSGFTADRNGIPNAAKVCNGTATDQVTLSNIPIGSTARTISMWYKKTDTGASYPFYYGVNNLDQAYGYNVSSTGVQLFTYKQGGNTTTAFATNTTDWYHVVAVSSGFGHSLFVNGNLIFSTSVMGINTGFSAFQVGAYGFTGAVDDLKIFNTALNTAEVELLYNSSLLTTQNFQANNLKAKLYPNPASDNFTIEMENEVKSIEIYSLQGHKVMNSNTKNVNVSSLSKGMYLVRIEDENNAVSTQKLIIK
jgi:hypothetical protein